MLYLLNAFSANMLAEFPASVNFAEVTADQARLALMCASEEEGEADFVSSAVGHADTATVFGVVLGIPVECRRVNVVLGRGDGAILGQYIGPRLPEGATALPEGAAIKWMIVEVV